MGRNNFQPTQGMIYLGKKPYLCEDRAFSEYPLQAYRDFKRLNLALSLNPRKGQMADPGLCHHVIYSP